jgi:hypothetical protein
MRGQAKVSSGSLEFLSSCFERAGGLFPGTETELAAKSPQLDSLELDLENPRITLAMDQRDAMQKIISGK